MNDCTNFFYMNDTDIVAFITFSYFKHNIIFKHKYYIS